MHGGMPFDDQITSGQTAHGAPVDDPILPFFIIAEEGRNDMLNGVHGVWVNDRLDIGRFHADIKGGGIFAS